MNHIVNTLITDKHGKVVLFQRPNTPLIIWFVLLVVAKIIHTGVVHMLANALSFIAIITWSLLELFWGTSIARRILGFAVLVVSVVSRF